MHRIHLASLAPQLGFEAAAKSAETITDTSGSECQSTSLRERSAPFDYSPAAFDKPIGLSDGCAASFAERFGSAMPLVASSLRPQERNIGRQRLADAPQSIVVSKPPAPVAEVSKPSSVPGDDGRIAVYDITAHTVYLPSGRRLEAHSGLGSLMDDPRHVQLRMRGATPPNVYKLTFREGMFHGVRAIRLNPVDEGRMYGRGGILAHTYMLGSSGQSNGCVAFRNYPEFLEAFRKGEISRLAVVDRLESPPARLAAGQLPERVKELMKATDHSPQYAAAGGSNTEREHSALAQ
jgi:hypothetical protein